MRDSENVTFGGGTLDRAGHLRDDPAAMARLLGAAETRMYLHWRGKILFETGDATRLAELPAAAPVLREAETPPIFMGLRDGAARFAFDISNWDDPAPDPIAPPGFTDQTSVHHPSLDQHLGFFDLRATMAALSPADAGNAATIKGIFGWHEIHGFCARCGAASAVTLAGWRRTCPDCGAHHFPRTDPVVIMLITHGNDLLLGRNPNWPSTMYSLLAGFMEPGETVEAAVRRETFEETGVVVGPVTYLANQPWPFPASLMIGCLGEAETREITLDPVEIEDARWISREAVMAIRDGANPDIRPSRPGSIARFLIDAWLADRLG